jgi:hypothetical protein
MAVRGEEVAGSIDAHVRESIERLVGEIRSSVEDVRVAVDQQLKAALQSVQADVNSISFLPHIQKSISEFEEALSAAKPSAAAGADAGRLKRAVQVVEQGKSQVDVLNALLEQCLDFGSRAALLILRGEMFSGWKGVGFAAHGGNDETIKRFNATPGLIPQLDEVLRSEHVVVWDGANLSTRFGVGASERAILVPMVIKDKVAAAVYVDAVGDDIRKLDPASIQLLVFTTGLLVDTLANRKKLPSPSLVDGPGASAEEPFLGAAPASHPPKPAAAPQPPRPAPAAPAPSAAATADSTVAFSAQQVREMMSAPPKASTTFTPPKDFATPTAPPVRPAPAAAPPPPPPAPAAAHDTGAVHEDRPSTQYIPPAGVAPRTGFGAAQGEEGKRHDEARRFARLLVSEIKLYNEPKVEQGRKNHDLYERLKEDIDRSRQMYDERISDDVRKASNYFYDELVRILADGNADALGL